MLKSDTENFDKDSLKTIDATNKSKNTKNEPQNNMQIQNSFLNDANDSKTNLLKNKRDRKKKKHNQIVISSFFIICDILAKFILFLV